MSAICVIGMRVCENSLSDWLPRVDVKIALATIKPTVGESYQAGAFHVALFYNGTANDRQKKSIRQNAPCG